MNVSVEIQASSSSFIGFHTTPFLSREPKQLRKSSRSVTDCGSPIRWVCTRKSNHGFNTLHVKRLQPFQGYAQAWTSTIQVGSHAAPENLRAHLAAHPRGAEPATQWPPGAKSGQQEPKSGISAADKETGCDPRLTNGDGLACRKQQDISGVWMILRRWMCVPISELLGIWWDPTPAWHLWSRYLFPVGTQVIHCAPLKGSQYLCWTFSVILPFESVL